MRPWLSSRVAPASTSASTLGKVPLRLGKSGQNAVGISEVEDHALGHLTGHLARFEVNHEQCLLTDNLLDIDATFGLHASEDGALVISESDTQLDQLLRIGHVVDGKNPPTRTSICSTIECGIVAFTGAGTKALDGSLVTIDSLEGDWRVACRSTGAAGGN